MTSVNAGGESALNKYMSVVGPLMESAGAKVINRFELSTSIAGTNDFQFMTLVEYPDQASVSRVFDSDEYKSLKDLKKIAFSKYQVNVIATM
jgi:uncharacterized protein (DUF1330 family)